MSISEHLTSKRVGLIQSDSIAFSFYPEDDVRPISHIFASVSMHDVSYTMSAFMGVLIGDTSVAFYRSSNFRLA